VQVPDVVEMQCEGPGVEHAASAEHAPPMLSQVVVVDIAHVMPDAQSESVAQGASSQVLISVDVHAGAGAHSSPLAHAGVAHPLHPVVWHVRPWPQSASVTHDVDASARSAASDIEPATATNKRHENCRG
jgi:hypothetical protein